MRSLHLMATSLVLAGVAASSPGWAQAVVNNYGDRPAKSTGKELVNKLKAPNRSSLHFSTGESLKSLQPGVVPGSVEATGARPAREAYGPHGIPYTTTRVQLGASRYVSTVGPNFLSTTTPYRQVGKLLLSTGEHCTATLIRRSVIVTAAHCIQDFGAGARLIGGYNFIPGYYNGPGATATQRAPYGEWPWAALWRPPSWANGTDTGDGAARNNDIAVIILKKNAANQFLGDLIGYLTYSYDNYGFITSPPTGNLGVASTTTLGYPGILDEGEILQRTDGPSYLNVDDSGALLYTQGNNFGGGASGGPWFVNFKSLLPALAPGAVQGTAPFCAIIGVTSWGSPDPNPVKDNYSSRFGRNKEFPLNAYGIYGAGNIGAAVNGACTQFVSPGVTYAAAGYCN